MRNRSRTNKTEKIAHLQNPNYISGFFDHPSTKSTLTSLNSGRIFATICGKYVHHNRETAKIGIRAPLKVYVYFRFVSETTDI